jgi:hypothetical protein
MDSQGNMGIKQLRYDGVNEPKEFLKAFSLQALMYKWDEAVQANAIALMLTGKAERIYDALDATKQASIKDIKDI